MITAEGEIDSLLFAVAENGELDGVAGYVFANESRNGAGAANFDAVDFSDDIFVFETGFVARTTADDSGVLITAGKISAASDGKIISGGDVGRNIDVINAEVGAVARIVFHDVAEHAFDARNRDRETNTISFTAGGSVDANDLAGGVDERAARVAGVDGGVGLDHVGEVLGGAHVAAVGGKGAASARNDAVSDSVLVLAESITDSDDGLASGDSFRIAKSDRGEIIDVINLEEGNIIKRVGADESNFVVSFSTIKDNFDIISAVDNVFISENIAVFGDDHASTGRGLGRRLAEPASSARFGNDRDYSGSDFTSDFSDAAFSEVGGITVGTTEEGDRSVVLDITKDG